MVGVAARDENVSLITDLSQSPGEDLARRRRRYGTMMALRVVCVLGAVSVYRVSIYLALAFVVGGAVLPWCAVLIANDRLPKSTRARRPNVHVDAARSLPPVVLSDHPTGSSTGPGSSPGHADNPPADQPPARHIIEG